MRITEVPTTLEGRLFRCVDSKGNYFEGDSTEFELRSLHLYQWSSPFTFVSQIIWMCDNRFVRCTNERRWCGWRQM